jgi:hypothetical protein
LEQDQSGVLIKDSFSLNKLQLLITQVQFKIGQSLQIQHQFTLTYLVQVELQQVIMQTLWGVQVDIQLEI